MFAEGLVDSTSDSDLDKELTVKKQLGHLSF